MNFLSNNKVSTALTISVLCIILYFPLFLHLEKLPMRIWDEARLAVNACEMHLNHNYLVTYFDGKPDMWNTKPPLMIWIQTFLIKIFGVCELAIRLPSAIAAFFTAVLLIYFSKRFLTDAWFGIIAGLMLITSFGYVHHHGTRTGDYDSLLTLITTTYCLAYFIFLESGKQKYMHLFFLGLTFAVLTKSIQGLLFLPALAIYSFTIKGKVAQLLKNKWFYFDAAFFILIIAGYYLSRENFNPGYLQAVSENELGGRYLKSPEGHDHEFLFYYNSLIDLRYSYWYLLFIPGILFAFFKKNKIIRRIVIFSAINVTTYLLIISTAKTKLEWYDLPLYPFLCIVGANAIYWFFSYLKENNTLNRKLKINFIPMIFLILIFLKPYERIINKVYTPQENEADFYRISYFLRELIKDPNPDRTYDICWDNHDKSHILFYVHMLNDKGKKCSMRDCRYLKPGEKVVAIQDHEKEFIEKFYTYEILETYYHVKTYKIIESLQ